MAVISLKKPAKPVDLATLAKEIVAEQKAARDAAQTTIKHAIRCGTLLIEAKAKVKHGQWLPWLKESCYLAESTARAYMNLARHADSLPPDVSVRDALKLLTSKPRPRKEQAKPKASAQPKVSKTLTVSDLPGEEPDSQEPDSEVFDWHRVNIEEAILLAIAALPTKGDALIITTEAVEKCFPETGFSIDNLPEE